MGVPFALVNQGLSLGQVVEHTMQPHLEKWGTHFEGVVKRAGPSPFFAGLQLT